MTKQITTAKTKTKSKENGRKMGGPENAISVELTTMRAAMSAGLSRDHLPAMAKCRD